MPGTSTVVLMLAQVASFGVATLVQLLFILVVATVVRRHRPDASPLLLLGLCVEVLVSFGTYASQFLLSRMLVGAGAATRYTEAFAWIGLAASLGHAMGRGLLIWGTVRLASPASNSNG